LLPSFACVEKNNLPFTNAIKNSLYVIAKIMLVISIVIALREGVNMRKRITKELAQQRMNDMLEHDKFEILDWDSTYKPATIKCKLCGDEINFKQGQTMYLKKTSRGGFNGECNKCNRYKFAYQNIKTYENYIEGYKNLIDEKPANEQIYLEKIKENKLKIDKEKEKIKEYEELTDK
jgi:hypothetical protein